MIEMERIKQLYARLLETRSRVGSRPFVRPLPKERLQLRDDLLADEVWAEVRGHLKEGITDEDSYGMVQRAFRRGREKWAGAFRGMRS
jgi:hypothetical protein